MLARTPGVSPAVGLLIARIAKYVVILLGGTRIRLSFLGASVQPLIAIAIIVVILVIALRGVANNSRPASCACTRHPISPVTRLRPATSSAPCSNSTGARW